MDNRGNGYIHMHFSILDNSMWFSDNNEKMTVGDGLLNFIYSDIMDEHTDFDEIHPYFKNCSESWKSDFKDHISGRNHISRMPELQRIKELQKTYKEILEGMFSRSDPYLDKQFINKKAVSRLLILSTACFASMQIEEGASIDYFISTFEESLFLEYTEFIKRRIILKLCKNCHKLFVPLRSNMEYCQRIYTEYGKTCQEYAYHRSFDESLRNDDLLAAYTRAYKTHYARMMKPRKKAANMTRDEFEAWYRKAKQMLDQARKGEIDPQEYKDWLKI